MVRLSLVDKKDESSERNLPICRMCYKVFAATKIDGETVDAPVAAFRPCGHVFHFHCIMERYYKMEDCCTCVTCFSKFEDVPIQLYLDWSKNASAPVAREVSDEYDFVETPDPEVIQLRETLDRLKQKLDSHTEMKKGLSRELDEINDAMSIVKSQCDKQDDIYDTLTERISTFSEKFRIEHKLCEELSLRIRRDQAQATIGKLGPMVQEGASEGQLTDFLYKEMATLSDPDELLARLAGFHEHYRKKVRDSTNEIAQLRTAVHSTKKDITETQQRIRAGERAKLVKSVVATNARPTKVAPAVVDRKVLQPRTHHVQPTAAAYLESDDLGLPRKKTKLSNFNNLFN